MLAEARQGEVDAASVTHAHTLSHTHTHTHTHTYTHTNTHEPLSIDAVPPFPLPPRRRLPCCTIRDHTCHGRGRLRGRDQPRRRFHYRVPRPRRHPRSRPRQALMGPRAPAPVSLSTGRFPVPTPAPLHAARAGLESPVLADGPTHLGTVAWTERGPACLEVNSIWLGFFSSAPP